MHEVPVLGEAGTLRRDGGGLGLSYVCLHVARRACGARSPQQPARSTACSTTNGISTSSTTSCSCARQGDRLRPLARRRCQGIIDRFGPDGFAADHARDGTPGGPAADRLRLPLRLRHADRRRGPGQLVPLSRRCGDRRWPTGRFSPSPPSCRWWVPASSSASAASPRSWRATPAAWRLWTSLVTFLLSLMVWGNFDPAQGGFQLVEKADWLPGLGVSYHMGVDGISLWFVLLSALLTLVVVDRLLALGARPRQGVHDRLPGHGHADDRRVLRRSTSSCSISSSRAS